jgi:two-component system CheB/CheR fusion protein
MIPLTSPTNLSLEIQSETPQPHNPFPVVGVGASAGGLEAFTLFLQQIPADSGMAYVLIQHLDPKHESILAEILAKVAKIPVHEVTQGMRVEPNHVYVIPSEMDIAIVDGSLSLLPRLITRGQHMPIDTFFSSLADIQASGAIGIILSGNGSDGALGLQEIHSKGGIILVQDPSSAKFDGMPRNAIATGCAHFILPPEGIAKELARIGRHPYVNGPSNGIVKKDDVAPTAANDLNKIFGVMRNKTGVDFSSYKRNTIDRRIQRRMVLHKTENLSDYLTYLKENPAEIDNLYNDILIKVTRFFRDPEVFEFLKSKVFEGMMQSKPSDAPIRLWVPACSTGEEVYSLAIGLLEFLGDRAGNAPIQIFGTDISDKALEKARAGLYIENIEADVSPERLRRFFTKTAGHYQVNKSVRELCIFAKQNIVKDPPFSKVDLISCRNVLIYLSPILQKRVLPTFHFALNPNGRLMLGSSETVGHFSDLFTVLDQNHRVYAKNAHVAAKLHFDFSMSPYAGDQSHDQVYTPETGPPIQPGRSNVQKEIDRVFLNRYTPVGVVVNDNLEILQFRGDTSPYLFHPSGDATFRLFKMVREGLQAELDAAIKEAKAKDLPYRKNSLRFENNGETKEICLEVIPIKIHLSSSERYWGIMFRELLPRGEEKKTDRLPVTKENCAKQMAGEEDASRWMASTKTYLESVIEEKEAAFEELQSANEEVLSSNEELQSINEEMQTAKEELQSTNEELTTVNDELRHSNLESIKLVNDLNNLVDSVNLPIVMVGNDLTIRRFTPQAGQVLHLLASDVGRPLRDINTALDLVNLEKLILDAIDTISVKEQKIKNGADLWYSVRIRPYKTMEKKIDGAVITLIDIDSMKRTEEQISKARDAAEDVLNTVREPLVVLDSSLRVKKASSSFYKTFNVSPGETENRCFFDLENGQWNNPTLRTRLGEVVSKNIPLFDFPIDQEFETIGRRFMMLNASKILFRVENEPLVLLAIVDMTDQKKAQEELARSNKDLEDFAHIVSHDLQSPLKKIISFGDLLKMNLESPPEKVLEYLSRMQTGAAKMSELIASLLSFSRATASKKTEPVDMNAGLKDALSELEIQITEAGAKVTSENLPTLNANKTQINQLMTNLIGNAIKYCGKEAPLIHVSAKKEGQVWVCSVRDNGLGIDKKDASRIFDLFQRIITEDKPGTGIGLTICKKIVEYHGGQIWVESELNKGSTFYFTLPVS